MGDQNVTAAPSGTFEAADGPLNIAANRQEQYETLCHVIERTDLVHDPRFLSIEHRKRNRDELNRELNKALGARAALTWERMLSAAGVPAARILGVPDAVALEQLQHREFFQDLPFPEDAGVAPGRQLRVSGNGVLLNGIRLRAPGPPPRLGEHNDDIGQILQAWGHDDDQP
jgi:crotonobetainyl-CoA:carnitine CoA-transferase CaiB-like acyl-CoA transferase